jgi:hypothetical protein
MLCMHEEMVIHRAILLLHKNTRTHTRTFSIDAKVASSHLERLRHLLASEMLACSRPFMWAILACEVCRRRCHHRQTESSISTGYAVPAHAVKAKWRTPQHPLPAGRISTPPPYTHLHAAYTPRSASSGAGTSECSPARAASLARAGCARNPAPAIKHDVMWNDTCQLGWCCVCSVKSY